MSKNKQKKFQENQTFKNLFQPELHEILGKDFHLKGQWHEKHFGNCNPIVLELGCGKGEYTVNLARMFPNKNFIGIDIKGARIWTGAKEATGSRMENVAFIRTRIEHIASFFAPNEVSEIWVTFPDPQPRASKARKRLTSSRFLAYYQQFTLPNALVHLKTDSLALHTYTQALAEQNGLSIKTCTQDLYRDCKDNPLLGIRTFYEGMFLAQGMPITYICFQLPTSKELIEPNLEQR